ncbi:DUF6089 family protein [uncultured Microscilla sp.]|uniref:type IX secretion system protein PorG n=1 Tax=uncultured Microscilla sp. TaxID=432653 RepID=UPI002621A135|nr:DUF6089 family protein [uncultured Microscilla sp.]
MKSLKYIFIAILSSVLIYSPAKAQIHEVGIMAGLASYKGEMSQYFPNLHQIDNVANRIAVGAFYRGNFSRSISIRGNFTYGKVDGTDANGTDFISQQRGHFFQTDLLELSAQIEYNFRDFRRNLKFPETWTPYLFVGVGGMKMSPRYNLLPTYGLYSITIPIGIGMKFMLNDKLNLGMEFGARKTFTDFIDDIGVNVDQAGNPRNPIYFTGNTADNDMYFFTGFTLSYVMPIPKRLCPIKIKTF